MSAEAPEAPNAPRPNFLGRVLGRLGLLDRSTGPAVFFVLTVCSVFWAGIGNGEDFYASLGVATTGWRDPAVLRQAFIYTGALIAILGTHEMGHWLVSRWHGVKTSLPLFIPVPFGIGTFGAVIAMKDLPPDRRTLLRIGAAGPLAGGVVAIVLMVFAIPTCPLMPAAAPGSVGFSMNLGESLGMKLIEWALGSNVVSGDNTLASPLFMAAWVGFLLTSMNLFPIGQLDGGHVAFAIFGERMNRLAKPLALGVISLVFFGSFVSGGLAPSYFVWGWLLFFFIGWHPPVPHPEEKLPRDAWILAALSIALFALTFMIAPMSIPWAALHAATGK